MEGFLEGEINNLREEKLASTAILDADKIRFVSDIKGLDGEDLKESLSDGFDYFNDALKKIDQDRIKNETKLIKKQEKTKFGKLLDRIFEII